MQQHTAQYLKLYGFHSPPFGLSPDPSFFFPSPSHQAAGKILSHAIDNGEGFMVLSGRAGLGKTLLLRRILGKLGEHKVPILILSPAVDAKGLMQLLLGEIGLGYDEQASIATLLQIFQNHILQMAEEGKELFIVVDEAQNMPPQTLEQLRMLSNLETGQKKLMQILLIGQTELEKVLANPGLGQLVQRIVAHERLQPLTSGQVAQYVAYRLQRAGGEHISLSKSGCRLLARASQGIPRLINRIMDRTLLLASLDANLTLTKHHVKTAIRTMKDINSGAHRRSRFGISAVIAIIVFIAATLTCLIFKNEVTEVFSKLTAQSGHQEQPLRSRSICQHHQPYQGSAS